MVVSFNLFALYTLLTQNLVSSWLILSYYSRSLTNQRLKMTYRPERRRKFEGVRRAKGWRLGKTKNIREEGGGKQLEYGVGVGGRGVRSKASATLGPAPSSTRRGVGWKRHVKAPGVASHSTPPARSRTRQRCKKCCWRWFRRSLQETVEDLRGLRVGGGSSQWRR